MQDIKIYCENTQSYQDVPLGTTLDQVATGVCSRPEADCGIPTLAALVDNKLKPLSYRIITPHNIRFIGYNHPDGRRTYIRSLCFVLQKTVHELFPDKVLAIDYALPSG